MKTTVLKIDPYNPAIEVINKAINALRKGGLVILPTETVYGLAADIKDKNALDKLQEIKNRPPDKPFAIAIDNFTKVEQFSNEVCVMAHKLMHEFWPGPLTLVLKSKDNNTLGFRVPKSLFTLKVLESFDRGVALPSANISGEPAPVTIEDALSDLDGRVELAIDSGKTEIGQESSVVEIVNSTLTILREGAIKKSDLEKIAYRKNILIVCTGNSCRSVMAAALLKKELKDRQDVLVKSAGIFAPLGMGASREIMDILSSKEDIDVSGHIARKVTSELLKRTDLILVMEKLHEKRIIEIAPEVKTRVFLLKEFAKIEDTDLDIPDPIGQDRNFYLDVYYLIKEAISRIAKII